MSKLLFKEQAGGRQRITEDLGFSARLPAASKFRDRNSGCLGELAQGILEFESVPQHYEIDRTSTFSAAEAKEVLLSRVDAERRRFLLVKWAEAHVPGSPPRQAHART